MLLLFYYSLKYIYNFSAISMSCIIPTRPSKTAVSVYILLFHQFIDFNSCALNSNLSELSNRLLKGKAVIYTPTDIFDKIIFRKIGPVVLVELKYFSREILNTETNKTINIGTIPEGYRPSTTYATMVLMTLSGIPMYFGAFTSGELSVRVTRTIAAGTASYGSCVYLSNP